MTRLERVRAQDLLSADRDRAALKVKDAVRKDLQQEYHRQKEESKVKTEEAGSAKESRRESFKQNRAFIEAKKVFRGDDEVVGNETLFIKDTIFLIEILVNGSL